jgi:hypothetical protein
MQPLTSLHQIAIFSHGRDMIFQKFGQGVSNLRTIVELRTIGGTCSGVLLLVSTTLMSMHVLADVCGSVVFAFSGVPEVAFAPAIEGALLLQALLCPNL